MATLMSVFWMLWSAPAVVLSSVVQVILRAAGWLEVYHRPGSWAADEFYRPIKLEEEGLK